MPCASTCPLKSDELSGPASKVPVLYEVTKAQSAAGTMNEVTTQQTPRSLQTTLVVKCTSFKLVSSHAWAAAMNKCPAAALLPCTLYD